MILVLRWTNLGRTVHFSSGYDQVADAVRSHSEKCHMALLLLNGEIKLNVRQHQGGMQAESSGQPGYNVGLSIIPNLAKEQNSQ
jgi:hypothetical protein